MRKAILVRRLLRLLGLGRGEARSFRVTTSANDRNTPPLAVATIFAKTAA